ncbi:hypothetical protein PVAND_000882 [Polypedilum vanderplanki]|uniref:Uncharacterized protein n=1 Tax=Polypedilum vanderplanki TaxID=319348 RepID=A0A9J6BLI8_POLVA|nr:hypothetical protein PVAND_000882 [Polypedilum vanderplanki]
MSFFSDIQGIFIRGASYKKSTRCDGKVVIITGANAGIGKETAVELAARGAKVYIACRSIERGQSACKEIIQRTGNENVFVRKLDLASFASIREFAKGFLKEEKQFDILINNPGVMAIPLWRTEDLLEMQIGVNHFGHFLLTNLLLPLIKATESSRIINVSSMAHRWGKIKTDDLNSEKSYNEISCYAQSKLANILFTRELAKRLKDTKTTVNALHPGVVKTELARHVEKMNFLFNSKILSFFMYFFNKTAKQGAQTTIYAALDPDLANVSGQYFAECGLGKIYKQGLDDDIAKWLWNVSEKWTKLDSKSE